MNGEELAQLRDPRAAALAYIEQGWPVVPTAGIVSRHCGCRLGGACSNNPGKHPLNHGGVNDPTLERRDVLRWWDQWPWAGVGIVTGRRSGLLVVDVDTKRVDGFATLERLAAAEGVELTETLAADTGSGGAHFVFTMPAGRWMPSTVGEVPGIGKTPGVDLRGEGTYIVAAPSAHLSGNRYGWRERSGYAMPAPSALLARMPERSPDEQRAARSAQDRPRQAPAASPAERDRRGAYLRSVFAGEVDRVEACTSDRNMTLYHSARRLGRYVAGGALGQEQVEQALTSAALTAGLEAGETRRTIASGIKAGAKEPRTGPPPASAPRRTSARRRERQDPPGPPAQPSNGCAQER